MPYLVPCRASRRAVLHAQANRPATFINLGAKYSDTWRLLLFLEGVKLLRENSQAEILRAEKIERPTPGIMRGRRRPAAPCPARLRGWWFSPHARAAVVSRGFDPHEVIRTCEEPEISVSGYDYGPDRFRYVRGEMVVIAVPHSRQIVTVLLRSYQQWNNNDARKAVTR